MQVEVEVREVGLLSLLPGQRQEEKKLEGWDERDAKTRSNLAYLG